MKTNITLAVALFVICINHLQAQESANVNAAVTRSFNADFSDATNIQWEPQEKGIVLVKFRANQETRLAYYQPDGILITSGRKVSTDQLPLNVKGGLERVQSKYESKFGSLEHGSMYEMIKDGGTQYFIPLVNGELKMLVSIDDSGSYVIQQKVIHRSPVTENESAIAKKD